MSALGLTVMTGKLAAGPVARSINLAAADAVALGYLARGSA
jgi:hypothetical protein